jgi:nucleoid-associated protein YgaU
MYAAGHGIEPWRANRAGGVKRVRLDGHAHGARRILAAVAAVSCLSIGFALGARGDGPTRYTTVVVQPGDTLWSIAAAHYSGDDVRVRVQDIEQANGLAGPTIEVGQTLKLPG